MGTCSARAATMSSIAKRTIPVNQLFGRKTLAHSRRVIQSDVLRDGFAARVSTGRASRALPRQAELAFKSTSLNFALPKKLLGALSARQARRNRLTYT